MSLRLRNDNGFSLVETLVATFILALVSGSGVMILSGYQDGRLRLAEADGKLAAVESTHAILQADLLHALSRPVRDAFGGSQPGFEGGSYLPGGTVLRLVRNGHMGALVTGQGSGLERVEYLVSDQGLVRRSYGRTDITPDTETRERLLLSSVRKLLLRFSSGGQWLEEWRGGSATAPLPELVTLTIEMADRQVLTFTLMVGGRA